jgi:transglutaminase-like putative cysteine protease
MVGTVGAGLADRFLQLSLLGLITSGCLALAGSGNLDAPAAILTFAGLLLRLLQLFRLVRFEIPGRIIGAATLLYLGFFPLDWAFVSREFLKATIHLACFLAVVKVFTAATARDFVQVKVIALLLLVAAAILSVSLNFFAFLVLFLVFGVATFTASEIRRAAGRQVRVARGGHHRFAFRLSWMSLTITAGILGITAGLFFLLPRTAHAAFQRFVAPRIHLPGFSREVRLGEIGRVLHQTTPVMHIRLHGKPSGFPTRWRGAALGQFDGRRWFEPPGPSRLLRVEGRQLMLASDDQRRRPGQRIFYEVDLKGIASDTLFFAGVPEFLVINASAVFRDPSNAYRLGYPPGEGLRYIAYSYLGDLLRFAPAADSNLLQLPPLDPRIARLAREITQGLEASESKARAVERHLRTSYAYTTELPEEEMPDPLAHFLFERKKGHCEYYASAMAVMLRSLGIPSRVVTGFHGGELNPISGWYVVRASDAHSWVEAYLESGWTTFDPTPPAPAPRRASLWARVNHYIDAAEMFWHEWVVDYDRERQLQLAMTMESSSRGFGVRWLDRAGMLLQGARAAVTRWIALYGNTILTAAVSLAAGWLLGPLAWRAIRTRVRVSRARRGQAQAGDATLLYRRMLEILERRGYQKPTWITPGEFARQIPIPETATLVAELTGAYHELRYGGRRDVAPRITELLSLLDRSR